ncbi:MFS transporter [Nocardia cyriacigeorgica]|uniref:MFS transporter n=1 Tax=Nocardia cyriacigeorgica TaxID=135487 RepID=A0A6P1DBD8_9NOCA|nr:MFS transporter [Nocardia cyriacigeorgica]NEW38335.1 MFS transporter [Nocardia cyriacigeorgica]NEW46919.1 MFS transporter [Nocardia cyriacigeorgica]NEW49278.1 MFS transporter [Nocardia cyriacigeorgica]NEW54235.1 MFS transporter [Nocardia cyriacigeorgica]
MDITTGISPDLRDTPPRATTRDWIGLAVLALALLLLAVDATVLDIAVPAISADLAPSTTQLLWIIDVYSFVLAGLLVVMGNLGDRIGRRTLLLIGAAGFGLASLLAAWAVSPEMLIAARVLQGITGATLMPATLGLIRSMFHDPRQRTFAIGVWGAMAGGGAAAGPLLGGWLLEHYWWGSVFLVNMPIMLALIALGPLLIPESKDPNPGRFDIPSAVLSMLALVPFVYAVKEIAAHGLSPATLVAAVVGVSAGVLFVRRQRTLERPMLDLRLFAVPQFRTAVVTNLLAVFALAGVLFFGSQYLQLVLGHSPLQAGMLLLPGMVASVVGSLLAAVLVRWWRPTSVLGGSLALAALGSALFLWLTADAATGMAPFVLGFGLIGTGVGIALTVSSDLVVSSAPAERAGAAAAISETAYETGIALGVAVLGSIVMAVFRNGIDVSALPADAAGTAVESLGGVADLAGQLPAAAGASLLGSAHESFVTGIHLASVGIAGILLVAAVVAFRSRAARS